MSLSFVSMEAGKGLVNNVCALTDASSDYSPDDRALISVSVLGLHSEEGLPSEVQQELMGWFGESVGTMVSICARI
jgi:hypothetical protein